MFKPLRLQLTLLYAVMGIGLIAVVGGGLYGLMRQYFVTITDLALQHKMAHEFHALDAPLPAALLPADRDWSTLREELGWGWRTPAEVARDDDDDEEEDDDDDEVRPNPLAYDAELAAIVVLPLDANGRIVFDPNPYEPLITVDQAALQAALRNGSDLRTSQSQDGAAIRLLTYRLTRPDGPAALQLGRILTDQDRLLQQVASSAVGLAALSLVLLSGASWLLAGRALRPAEEAWERQQRFIASASHELRTPLTLIRASAEVALRVTPTDDLDQRELLGDILTESDHMRRLVDDLLLLSRIDSGRLQLERQALDIETLLGELHRQLARLAEKQGLSMAYHAVAGRVWADPDRLRQVLLIFADNALRHTASGGQLQLKGEVNGRHYRISLSDSGSGIAAEHLPHIFERFYRVDAARGRNEGNAGLGLAIAQSLISAMGGHIGATSQLGQGTTIWLELPLAVPSKSLLA